MATIDDTLEISALKETAIRWLNVGIESIEGGNYNRANVLLDRAMQLFKKAADKIKLEGGNTLPEEQNWAIAKAWYERSQREMFDHNLFSFYTS